MGTARGIFKANIVCAMEIAGGLLRCCGKGGLVLAELAVCAGYRSWWAGLLEAGEEVTAGPFTTSKQAYYDACERLCRTLDSSSPDVFRFEGNSVQGA